MTEKPYYPQIDDTFLTPFRALEAQIGKFPDLLTRADCPYSAGVRQSVAKMLGGGGEVEIDLDLADASTLQSEIELLYTDLRKWSGKINDKNDKDKLGFFKTSVTLLEKLVALRERSENIVQQADFKRRVVEVLDNLLSTDQRSEFLEKLGAYINDAV